MKIRKVLAIGGFASMWASILAQNILLFGVCATTLCVIFGIKNRGSIFSTARKISDKTITAIEYVNSKFSSSSESKIKTAKDNMFISIAKPVINNKTMSMISQKINPSLEQEIQVSGRAHNPRLLTQKSVAYMVISAVIIIPIALLVGIFSGSIYFVLSLLPTLFLLYPKIRLKFIVSERKSSVDDEMAFFTLYGSVMQSIGHGLYSSILAILDKKVFPTIESEGKMLQRNVDVFSMDQNMAINQLGKSHPNIYFKNLLLGYVSIARSGGDLSRYMERKSEEFFNKMQFKYANYKNQGSIIAETMMILLSILPAMILTSSFLLDQESVNSVMGLTFVMVPVITMVIVMLVNLSQPKIQNIISFKIMSLVFGGATAGTFFAASQPGWLAIGAGIVVAAISNYVMIGKQFKEIASLESALPDFFRDITEYVKIGSSIQHAIIKLAGERSYNVYFDHLLKQIAFSLSNGDELGKILDTLMLRSWVTKTSFFVLAKTAESGGGTPEILEQITNFSSNINITKRETISSIAPITYISLGSPIFMAFIAKEMSGIISSLNTDISKMQAASFNIQTGAISPEMMATVNFLNIVIGFSIGLVMGKLTTFTIKNTLWIGLGTMVSILSILLMPYFPSLAKI